jgi:hypothetical protein
MRVSELLSLPVRLHRIELGRVADVLIDRQADRVVGFEVRCGDEARRFLAFAVVDVRPDELALESALTLIDERDLDYYRTRARRLSELGYADPWIDDDGAIHEALSAA